MSDDWNELIADEQYTEIDGVRTHFYDVGEGHPIVPIHGGGLTSCAELNWGAVIRPLAEHCRVVAVDQPGFGFTDLPNEDYFEPRTRADFLIDFLETRDVGPVTLAGNSEGMFGTIYIALTRPDLVEKVVIVNSRTPRPEEPSGDLHTSEPTMESTREGLEAFRDHHLVCPENHPLFAGPITDAKVERFHEIESRCWEYNNARHEMYTADRSVSFYDGRLIDYWAPELDQPGLLTYSTTPEIFPRVHYEDNEAKRREIEAYFADMNQLDDPMEMFHEMDDAEIHIWQDALHHVMTDQRDRWVEVVAGFLGA
jgi:pimeloyl-ACP methyl ester carboxylesterase